MRKEKILGPQSPDSNAVTPELIVLIGHQCCTVYTQQTQIFKEYPSYLNILVSIYLYVKLSVCLDLYLSIYLSICPPTLQVVYCCNVLGSLLRSPPSRPVR